MKKLFITGTICLLLFAFTRVTAPDQQAIQDAINKSLPLLQQSSHTFLTNAGGCHSCHGQGLGGVSFSLAKEKGFKVEDSSFNEAIESILTTWKRRKYYLAQNEDPVAITIGGGYDLWGLGAANIPATKDVQQLAKNIFERQRTDGSWVSPSLRPPMEYYSFTATALAIYGLEKYLPPVFNTRLEQKIMKARQWMMMTPAITNEEKVFQLLGMYWGNAPVEQIQPLAKKLLSQQQKNGGWSQLDSLSTDAYATGQSLYALAITGAIETTDPVYQQGLSFLLNTQHEDGSWRAKTRSFPAVDFVNSGFPHGDDQFISAAASNWATLALLLACTKKP
jgi:hypothetical protein